ncbi:MAG: ATP-binding cassette domain-containing protein [Acholeplasmatales bacterium]|nr:ATP-binding cassette domain-containing protein [Acholeplasmatales bacterium]
MSEISYVLKTDNLTKQYKTQLAVNNVNMHIEKGDIYGFVGENGAGKTTIIRLICGLINPTGGSFKLFDIDNNSKDILNARRKVSGIVEAVSINKSMTALENLRFQCLVCNINKTNEELEGLLDTVGLNYREVASKKTLDFSLGMRQRLGLAIAMVSNPEFIILDEPMNGLDPQGFIDVREIIYKLNKMGVTFLISSHILSELDKICNRIGFISHGVLLEELTIDELHHKSRRKIILKNNDLDSLKNFLIGTMNLNEVSIEHNSIFIYDDIDINVVMKNLVENDIKIEEIGVRQDSIEDYYISLIVGGKRNA